MKNVFIILICLSVSQLLMAQEANKQKEIGLVFNNFDSFGFTFKTGSETAMWRFNTLSFNGNLIENTNDNFENVQSNLGFRFNVGREYRSVVNENLQLRIGADLSFGFNRSKSEHLDNSNTINKNYNYYPGINMVLGLNYLVGDNLLLGAEVLPYFNYTKGIQEVSHPNQPTIKSEVNGFTWGVTNNWVLISVSYRL